MINLSITCSYCKEDISLIENYDKAITDNTQTWDCHHRLEIQGNKILSVKELKAQRLYYKRPACELIFLTHSEHSILHNKNRKDGWYKKISESEKGKIIPKEICALISIKTKIAMSNPEIRKKISNAKIGKKLSDEHRKKISESMKRKLSISVQ